MSNVQSKLNEVTVVITTLGHVDLIHTINNINLGLNKPFKIIICVPEPEISTIFKYNEENVEYLVSPSRGQVFQRSFAFNFVETKFVLQIDDDVLIDQETLISLHDFLKDKPLASVCPTLLGIKDHKPSNFMTNPKSNLFLKFMFFIVNGKKGYVPGGLSLSGINMGYNFSATSPYKVDWMPGGCVLHNTNNLILYNYYPYAGKAFSEDLLHSVLLTEKGVVLYHFPGLFCFFDKSSSSVGGIVDYLRLNFDVWRILNYYSSYIQSSKMRLYLYLFLRVIYTVFFKIKKIV